MAESDAVLSARSGRPGLSALLTPRSIAVIGAADDPTRVGGMPVHFLRSAGFSGPVYPVSTSRSTVQGLKAYASVAEIDDEVDLAVVVVPAGVTPAVVRQCADANVKAVVVLSGGFAEIGPSGAALQAELAAISQETGMRICGPNCAGVMNVPGRVVAAFGSHLAGDQRLIEGPVSIVSQSGAVGAYIFSLGRQRGLGIRHWVTTGNEVDVEASEVVEALAADDGTRSVALYVEQFRDPVALVRACEAAQRTSTSIVGVLAGRTAAAERSLQSHTGSMLGDREVAAAALSEMGVLLVDSVEELLTTTAALGGIRRPRGRGVGMVSISGGAGILMVDRCSQRGLDVPTTAPERQQRMKELLPYAATENPADVTGNISNDPEVFPRFVDLILESDEVDVLVCFLGHIVLSPKIGRRFVDELIALAEIHDKPVWLVAMDDGGWVSARAAEAGIPLIQDPVAAIDALARAVAAQEWFDTVGGSRIWDRRREDIPAGRLPAGVRVLAEVEAREVVGTAGVPVPAQVVARDEDEVRRALETVGEPCVLKVVASGLVHKSDIGGVAVGVTRATAAQAYARMVRTVKERAPDLHVEGVMVQEQVDGLPIIVGTRTDPIFGPVLRVGEGGIDAEAASGGVLALAPLDQESARGLVERLPFYGRLAGTRGRDPLAVGALVDALVAISRLAWAERDRIESIEVNPLMVGADRAVAADALAELAECTEGC